MEFAQWYLENGPDPKQQLFPWMQEEDPLDYKRMSRYKSPENYIKAQVKGSRSTENAARQVVSAMPNNYISGPETIHGIYNSEFVFPQGQFTDGRVRPEKHVAFVLLHKDDSFVKGSQRLVAVMQGDPNNRITKQGILDHDYPIIGGILFSGPYLTHAWIDPNYKSPGVSLYKSLREFARKYFGVVGLEPGDDLTSKSFRTSQAKYDWNKFQQWKNQNDSMV